MAQGRSYALFLGCNAPVRTLHYDVATRAVLERLGVHVVDLDGFACCGYPLEAADHLTAVIMAARNIALAEAQGLDVLAICSACSGTLLRARHALLHDERLRTEVNAHLRKEHLEFRGTAEVEHLLRFLHEDIGTERLRSLVTRPLTGWRVAVHYGCHYLKPSEVVGGGDDPEVPHTVDELVALTGATSVPYAERQLCCGGGVLGYREADSHALIAKKLDSVVAAGADALEVHCAFCAVMYDGNQKAAERAAGKAWNVPVLVYPQLLGLAMGIDPDELGFRHNRVRAKELLARLEGVSAAR